MKRTKYYIYSWPRRFDVTPKDMSKTVCSFGVLRDAYDYAAVLFKGADSSIFWCVTSKDSVAVRIMDQMVEDEFCRIQDNCFKSMKDYQPNILRREILKSLQNNKEDGDFK